MGEKENAPPHPGGHGVAGDTGNDRRAPGHPAAATIEVGEMRSRLIRDLKTPFIEHVQAAPSDVFIKRVKVENFDERVMTLPDKEIFDLYVDYLKTRRIENAAAKETVRNGILNRLDLSFFSHGWVLGRILQRK